jgi:hypothetical protein
LPSSDQPGPQGDFTHSDAPFQIELTACQNHSFNSAKPGDCVS